MTSTELNDQFGVADVLRFEEDGELTRAHITLSTGEATIYLQGAHLTQWNPAGQKPVLFLSEQSFFAPGKAIRGGVPICFPWFGGRSDGGPGPSHGFARTAMWELVFAALLPGTHEGDRVQLTFTLGATDDTHALGFDDFRVAYEVVIGRTLTMKMTVANFSSGPLRFEEALHAYFQVDDVRDTEIKGLASATYLDKRDANQSKATPAGPLLLDRWTDSVFAGNRSAVSINDVGNKRSINIVKTNSATTVVWNPWAEGAATLNDMDDDEWPCFVCVEAANTGADTITLQAGATHTMIMNVAIHPDAS